MLERTHQKYLTCKFCKSISGVWQLKLASSIAFTAPDGHKVKFERTNKQIPRKPLEVKPHPKGIAVDDLITMAKAAESRKISSFLKTSFDRMGDKALKEIGKNVSFDLNKDPRKLSWEEAEEIVKNFKQIDFIAPRLDSLRPIGEQRIDKSMKAIVEPEFISVVTRKPQVYRGGFPFQVEVAVAYGGNAGRSYGEERKIEIMRYANRAPLLFDSGGCAITKAVQSIDWKRYGVKDVEHAPLTIFVNVISVHIPYTSAGKQAIADEDEVMEELRLAIMDAARKTSKYIIHKQREKEKQLKRDIFFKYIPEIAGALSSTTKSSGDTLKKRLEKMVNEKLRLEEKEAGETAELKQAKPKPEKKKEAKK
jgi:DNA topoisomerase-6 subunit B